jgi:zinc/manganese transport system permease protein
VNSFLSPVFAPGFFESSTVHTALAVGGLVAVASGVVGVFTVLRGQSFAGHAFGDIGTTGGSGAYLVGIGPLWGFLIAGLAGAAAMEAIGVQRARGRDLATGIVLGAALGLAALFLYLSTTASSTTGATVTVLFGSIFAVSSSTIPLVIVLSAVSVAIIAVLYRPLLLSSVSSELAAARGIPVRVVGALYLLSLAVAVALAAITIGAILSTALLIGPAATALRLTKSPGRAILTAGLLGVATTCIGIVLAYDSFHWPPAGHGWPVSFFVVALVLFFYLLAGLPELLRARAAKTDHTTRGATAEMAA